MYMNPDKPENQGYFNLSEQEIVSYNKMDNEMRRLEARYNQQLDADIRLFAQSAVNDAFKATKPSDKNMRVNRHKEKHVVEKENYSIEGRLDGIPEEKEQLAERIPVDDTKPIDAPENEAIAEETEDLPEEEFDFDKYLKVAGRVNNG